MLMCDTHHRKIDHEEVKEHPAERLIKMKADHEKRIEIATSIKTNKQSHIILFGANVGPHNILLNWENCQFCYVFKLVTCRKTCSES